MEIGSGRTHEHTFNFDYNGYVSYAKATNENQSYMRGITHCSFLLMRGMPVDAENSGSTVGVVTTASCKVTFQTTIRVKTRIVTNKSKKATYVNTLGAVPTGGAAYFQQNEVDQTVNRYGVAQTFVDDFWG